MLYKRTLDLKKLLAKKSFFLLGPRATGKTFLINEQLSKEALIINLLKTDIYLKLTRSPHLLEEMIDAAKKKIIVIDEIQKIPILLNEVHRLIESKKLTFLLTGSSARKLKSHNVNLLAGRAWQANLFALTSNEIKNFDLLRYINYGGLPAVYSSKYPNEELIAYANTYLKEEIQAEALSRKIPSFIDFLEKSALASGHIINLTNISKDTGIPVSTLREYYKILEDTLIGFPLNVWQKTKKRKATSTAKFYFFDIGVRNELAGLSHISKNSQDFGPAFEHFIISEVRAYISYTRKHKELTFWRSKQGDEVDLIIGDDIAIEIKSSSNISDKHLRGLKRFSEEGITKRHILVSQDTINRNNNNIEIRYWRDFLNDLWQGEIDS